MVVKVYRPLGLHSAEIALILAMGLAATGFPIFIVYYLIYTITLPYYYATPENRWEEFIIPYLQVGGCQGRGRCHEVVLRGSAAGRTDSLECLG